jgi:putative flippase GtrA
MIFNFYKQPEFVRMLIVAIIGALLSFVTYEIVFYLNPWSPKATLSWVIAFIIGVVRQHALHRYFTFSHKTPYFKSLYKAYILDFGGLLYSSGLNWILSNTFKLNHRLVWLCCILSTALISFVFLKKYVFKVNEH